MVYAALNFLWANPLPLPPFTVHPLRCQNPGRLAPLAVQDDISTFVFTPIKTVIIIIWNQPKQCTFFMEIPQIQKIYLFDPPPPPKKNGRIYGSLYLQPSFFWNGFLIAGPNLSWQGSHGSRRPSQQGVNATLRSLTRKSSPKNSHSVSEIFSVSMGP